MITAEKLKKIFPNVEISRLKQIEAAITFSISNFPGMNDPDVLEEFIAQVGHESGSFRIMEESGKYSAKRLVQIFPKYFPDISVAKKFEFNAEDIFNKTYANRMGNGDERSGDGYRYRGGGFIQMTGKDMYKKYAAVIGRSIEVAAELVKKDDFFAMHSAMWIFAIEKNLIPYAKKDDFITITKRINGGLIGIEDRKRIYEIAKKVLREK